MNWIYFMLLISFSFLIFIERASNSAFDPSSFSQWLKDNSADFCHYDTPFPTQVFCTACLDYLPPWKVIIILFSGSARWLKDFPTNLCHRIVQRWAKFCSCSIRINSFLRELSFIFAPKILSTNEEILKPKCTQELWMA